MILEIVLVSANDWQAFYVNGEKAMEDHSINVYEFACYLQKYSYIESIKTSMKSVDEVWFDENVRQASGWLPDQLSDVKFE